MECHREFIDSQNMSNSARISISGNKRDDLCPICGSSSIELVEYTPEFIGGDIPRGNSGGIQFNPDSIKETLEEISAQQIGFISGRVIQETEHIEKGSIFDLSDMD